VFGGKGEEVLTLKRGGLLCKSEGRRKRTGGGFPGGGDGRKRIGWSTRKHAKRDRFAGDGEKMSQGGKETCSRDGAQFSSAIKG